MSNCIQNMHARNNTLPFSLLKTNLFTTYICCLSVWWEWESLCFRRLWELKPRRLLNVNLH